MFIIMAIITVLSISFGVYALSISRYNDKANSKRIDYFYKKYQNLVKTSKKEIS